VEGLNLVPNSLVLPHHNTFGKNWAPRLVQQVPTVTLIGIDEQTGMIDDGEGGAWTVHGVGEVTVYRAGLVETYEAGKEFSV
jgi:cyanophycinase